MALSWVRPVSAIEPINTKAQTMTKTAFLNIKASPVSN
jgi:hypothetical protein